MDENGNLLSQFTWRTITFYSTFISTGLLLIACLSIIVSLCDRKKKKSQAQPPGAAAATPKSIIKPAQPPSSGKIPSSPSPGGRHKNDVFASQNPKNPMAKSKEERKSGRQASNKLFAGALDKTQEESKRSAKSNSKESGENNNHLKKEDQAYAKETKDTEKKDEEEKKSTEPPPIVPEDKVQVLGNLDEVIKEKKPQLVKEIEDMGSVHEHDKVEKEPLNPEKHVVINEKKCKLYTTNNEETKEDDAPDDLI